MKGSPGACAHEVKGVKVGEGHSSTSSVPTDHEGSGPRDVHVEKTPKHDTVQVGGLQGRSKVRG